MGTLNVLKCFIHNLKSRIIFKSLWWKDKIDNCTGIVTGACTIIAKFLLNLMNLKKNAILLRSASIDRDNLLLFKAKEASRDFV